jgi:type I restriction enzyme M protein
MAKTGLDLISMADIARLAGESRATVGNWKARNPEDFPPERDRTPRGPLYDRAEVTRWLESRGRLDERSLEVNVVWNAADRLRDDLTIDEAWPLVLLLLAVMAKSSSEDWLTIRSASRESLDEVLRATAISLFPFADQVLPHRRLRPEALAAVVALVSQCEQSLVPLVADALLEHAAKAMGRSGGEYLSPPSVRRLMVAIAQPTGSVYNPASGIGQLMIDAAASAGQGAVELFGQEVNSRLWAMAQLNLAIHDVPADVAFGDVFGDDCFPQLRADRVISVPPWGQRLPIIERLRDDPRWVWGEPSPSDGNSAWIQHCLYHLADHGRAVIVLPNGVLFQGGRAGRIRQRVIKAGLLDAVLALPPGLFTSTGLACTVLVFTKGRPSVGGKPAPTLMVDLRESGERRTRRSTTLRDTLIQEVARIYSDWVEGLESTEQYTAVAMFDDLAANDFNIDPARYIALPPTTSDLDEAVDERSELFDRLLRLSQASRADDDQLKADLGGTTITDFEEVRLDDLKSLVTISRGFPTQRATPDGDLPVMSLAALRNGTAPKLFADRDDIDDIGIELGQPGDVLIAIEGGTVGETLVVPDGLDEFVPSQQVATLRVIDRARLDPWFLGSWFATEPAREQIRRLARGAGVQRVPIHNLQALTVMLPPLQEQRTIGLRFRAFENAIQGHRAITASLQDLRDLDLVVTFAGASTPDMTDTRGKQGR